jgi:hypothetical protein
VNISCTLALSITCTGCTLHVYCRLYVIPYWLLGSNFLVACNLKTFGDLRRENSGARCSLEFAVRRFPEFPGIYVLPPFCSEVELIVEFLHIERG